MKNVTRSLKRTGIGLGLILAVLLTLNAIVSWRAGVRLDALLNPIQASGEPLGLADLARKQPLPPDENAATFLRRAEKDVQALERELVALSNEEADYVAAGRLTDKGAGLVESALSAYPDVVPLLVKAADAPDYDPEYDYSYTNAVSEFLERYLPLLQSNRSAARLLRHRTCLLRSQNDRDGALRNALVSLRLSHHFSREPLLVGHLVALATRSMAIQDAEQVLLDGEVADELRAELEVELERSLDRTSYIQVLKSERAYGLESFHELTNLGGTWLVPWRFRNDECDYLELLAGEIALAEAPRYRVAGELDALQRPPGGVGMLTTLFAPALNAARVARDRVETGARCLRVFSALQVYLAKDGERSPEIDRLGLPAEMTTDPYNGKPLRLKQVDAGWIVYSVGENLKDDGGKLEKYEDVGVGLRPAP